MILSAYIGAAGCGKTTKLIDRVTQYLQQNSLLDYQKVLALTFMHGTRKRLDNNLLESLKSRKFFEASTIDSLALYLFTLAINDKIFWP